MYYAIGPVLALLISLKFNQATNKKTLDQVQELANEHNTLRRMLGHGDWADETRYNLQTLKASQILWLKP